VYWRIGEHESWFADMAAEGLHLKKMGVQFVQFVKGEPKKMRYRIDVSIKKKITSEQIQLYEESGWDYVTSHQFFHVFSSPEERNALELHTDPAEQSYTLKELDKKLVKNASIVAPWKKHHRLNTSIAFLLTVVVGLTAIIPFVQLVKLDTQTLPETSIDLPFVRLAEVEQNPAMVREEPYMIDNVDWGNRYTYSWSPLAPLQYETMKMGSCPEKCGRMGAVNIHQVFIQGFIS
jgi:hypothetical protein